MSILDPPEAVPHLQALVDEALVDETAPLRKAAAGGRLGKRGGNVIPFGRRDGEEGAEESAAPADARGVEGVPGAERDTGSPLPRAPAAAAVEEAPAAGRAGRFHVRRAVLAQDGHSSGEEVLYQSLWNSKYARQEAKDTRLVTIGWKAMSKLARMTPRNTRRNCQSLIDKLAMEQLSDENSRESIGRTYRLFSYKAILERRRAAGMEWITRSRGVNFVAGPGGVGMALAAAPPIGRGIELDPDAERVPGAKRDTGAAAPAETPGLLVLRTLREYLPDVDDASVAGLIEACRQKAADATEEEIDYFVRIKADLMQRMGTVKSPMGFLKTSVPRCFEGESFRHFREAEQQRREAAAVREAAQEAELRRFQEEQRAVLADPKSAEEDRKFARHYLGIPGPDGKGTGD